ncbi:hypothetical protein DH2020_000843 [Rehmannia glutinosa]|uniref:IBH1-like N-terminal domain-containing protein n=1 Tax=Rehmannia glutinosa TaxID=99300 RepID=A0ABR0XY92_REHGL
MKTEKNLPRNPSSIKTRFAVKFLQAMNKMNKRKNPSTSMAVKYKRYQFIRAAATSSMASAVGPRRAWSRAVLRKMRNHTAIHRFPMNNKTRTTRRFPITRRKRSSILRGNPRQEDDLGFGQEDDLRGLVPGGQGMDFCRLLSETAHYIKCLKTQVQVMTNVLHHYST